MKTPILIILYFAALVYACSTGSLLAIALLTLPAGVLLLAILKSAARPMPRPPVRRPYDPTELL